MVRVYGRSTSSLAAVYRLDDLPVFQVVDHIRRNPRMYVWDGGTPLSLAWLLARDATTLGATHVQLDVVDGWYLVSAEIDWLQPPYQCKRSPIPPLAVG